MPYTKLGRGKPKIDWPTAALIYRKTMLGISWDDIGAKCGYKGDSIRRKFMINTSDQLPVSMVRDALKAVDLDYRDFLNMGDD